jgi:hypothetical protein
MRSVRASILAGWPNAGPPPLLTPTHVSIPAAKAVSAIVRPPTPPRLSGLSGRRTQPFRAGHSTVRSHLERARGPHLLVLTIRRYGDLC